MTDSDIIKALECCLVTGQCKAGCFVDVLECEPVLFGAVQDLIKRQQAEIERLEGLATNMEYCANHALDEIEKEKREAIKDFTERLKARVKEAAYEQPEIDDGRVCESEIVGIINELVAETEGEDGRT